jgi:FkbM family methyltransferase
VPAEAHGAGVLNISPGRRFLWLLAWPVRAYVRAFPLHRGKGVLLRRVLLPILGPDATVDAPLPPGGVVRLRAQETLGWAWLIYGAFEAAELSYCGAVASSGGWVLDVGSNVGMFAVSVAQRVVPGARVLAFEPLPGNVERLRANVARSSLENVDIVALAAAESPGEAELLNADDAAYAGLVTSVEEGRRGTIVRVPVATIDAVWRERDRPPVSLMKLDIEGGELGALRGSVALLEASRPVLMVEAATASHLERLRSFLAPFGYEHEHPPGFEPWNHIFRPAEQGR